MTERLQVTKGSADDAELAAVVIALDVLAGRLVASEPAPVSKWKSSLRARPVSAPRDWHSRS
jgi:hypothetical protein